MTRNRMGAAGALLALLMTGLFAGEAKADPVSVMGQQSQTTAGQNFTFVFDPVPTSNGGPGSLTLRIRGDFSIGASLGESLDWSIDGGLASANDIQATNANVITSYAFDDNLWQQTFPISGAAMSAITGDNKITVFVDYASGVNLNLSTAFIKVTVAYDDDNSSVPEPAGVALFLVSAIGVALRRRRKRRA